MLKPHTLNDRICAHSSNAAHAMEVPPNARLLFCNGQVGARLDGTVPEVPREQIEVIFERIGMILTTSNMTFEHVVKFTVYVTDKSILNDYFSIRRRIMGDHNPPATLLIVPENFPDRVLKSRSKRSRRTPLAGKDRALLAPGCRLQIGARKMRWSVRRLRGLFACRKGRWERSRQKTQENQSQILGMVPRG